MFLYLLCINKHKTTHKMEINVNQPTEPIAPIVIPDKTKGNIEILKELVEATNLANIRKGMIQGFIERSEEAELERRTTKELIEKTMFSKKHTFDVLVSTDSIIVYKIVNGQDEWDIKYPYRSLYKDSKDRWVQCHVVSFSLETALLVALEHKFEAREFSHFAIKMLDIEVPK